MEFHLDMNFFILFLAIFILYYGNSIGMKSMASSNLKMLEARIWGSYIHLFLSGHRLKIA